MHASLHEENQSAIAWNNAIKKLDRPEKLIGSLFFSPIASPFMFTPIFGPHARRTLVLPRRVVACFAQCQPGKYVVTYYTTDLSPTFKETEPRF